jgi:hypothetical protein
MMHFIAEVLFNGKRMPTGRFLGVTEREGARTNTPVALVLVTEETLEKEIKTGEHAGMTVVQFRAGDSIEEGLANSLGQFLGSAASYHFFELKVPA